MGVAIVDGSEVDGLGGVVGVVNVVEVDFADFFGVNENNRALVERLVKIESEGAALAFVIGVDDSAVVVKVVVFVDDEDVAVVGGDFGVTGAEVGVASGGVVAVEYGGEVEGFGVVFGSDGYAWNLVGEDGASIEAFEIKDNGLSCGCGKNCSYESGCLQNAFHLGNLGLQDVCPESQVRKLS